MVLLCVKFALCVILAFETLIGCDGQFAMRRREEMMSPLPFPTCRADNIDCLRRGLRTFMFLMNTNHFGMKSVDPAIIDSVALALPEQQMSFFLRRVNATGVNWTKLVERRFNLEGGRSGVLFNSDLHVTAQLTMEHASRFVPQTVLITMDIQSVESNITYPWSIQQGIDNEDYIVIGPERIAVRNKRTPSFFLQPITKDSVMLDQVLQMRPSILEHFSNEITTVLMQTIVENFRKFASMVPIRYYYQYYVDDLM
ncbi:unnamed protein product [Arctia plantaginis]|uniref:Uncharacterized protein n=1 Tax=Arctia plantaginis TaxID=874455 RepID=A0A8S0Z517_ARCPL|nr:unnamed protein product [Arctia plantaginis]